MRGLWYGVHGMGDSWYGGLWYGVHGIGDSWYGGSWYGRLVVWRFVVWRFVVWGSWHDRFMVWETYGMEVCGMGDS